MYRILITNRNLFLTSTIWVMIKREFLNNFKETGYTCLTSHTMKYIIQVHYRNFNLMYRPTFIVHLLIGIYTLHYIVIGDLSD